MLFGSAGYGTWVFELAEKHVKLHESRQLSIDYSSKALFYSRNYSKYIAVKKCLVL